MQKKVADLNTFSLTQQLYMEYWNVAEEKYKKEIEEIITEQNTERFTNYFIYCLEKNGWEIEQAYSIIHNKDIQETFDTKIMEMVLTPKEPHIHASFKFKKGKNKGATLEKIAEVLGLEPQYIEKPEAGRFSWDNKIAYLVHAKDPNKYQYEPEEVYTAKGEDYLKIYHESIEKWRRGGIKKANKKAKEDIDWLEDKVLKGEILRPQIFLTDDYYKIYTQNKRRLEDAFESYGQRKMYKAIKKLENGEFKIKVYYITGKAGSGKTVLANQMIQKVKMEAKEKYGETWTVCKTASTNPVDDYNGEEILLMDDVRGSTMRADDWLKLLDPYNFTPSSARYRNKVVASRVIFITATISPVEFFYYSKGVGSGSAQTEAVDQFLRRLMAIIEVIDVDEIRVNRSIQSDKKRKHLVNKDNDGNSIYADSQIDIKPDLNLKNKGKDEIINDLAIEILNNEEENRQKMKSNKDEYDLLEKQMKFDEAIEEWNKKKSKE
jgi:ABC-type dipeptide/oligopeptide/nickel transport system ATPase component